MKLFTVRCCGRRRGLFPGGVLICSACDYDNEYATVMPNEWQARDVPPHQPVWHPGMERR